jgi:predicted NBD/HSP70 family sugar kinase
MSKPGNKNLMRSLNRQIILNHLRVHGPTSRSTIVKKTGLSAGAVSDITNELIGINYIFEQSTGKSSGGRKPIFLALNADVGFVVGIKLMETKITFAITNFLAEVIAIKHVEYLPEEPSKIIKFIAELVDSFIDEKGLSKDKLLGVGIGLAGIIDSIAGILQHSPYINWNNIPIVEMLSHELNVPIRIDNDVNTFTLTELWFGKGRNIDHFFSVTVGRGIGLGIVTNGNIYRGQGGAGELGHTVVSPGGRICECGKKGCLETFISDPALLNEAQQLGILTEKQTIGDLAKLALNGNNQALKIISSAGEILGNTLANLANIFDPEFIIVGGEGLHLGDTFIESLKEAFENSTMPALRGRTTIKIDHVDDIAWARGAAGLILQELFQYPI